MLIYDGGLSCCKLGLNLNFLLRNACQYFYSEHRLRVVILGLAKSEKENLYREHYLETRVNPIEQHHGNHTVDRNINTFQPHFKNFDKYQSCSNTKLQLLPRHQTHVFPTAAAEQETCVRPPSSHLPFPPHTLTHPQAAVPP